MPRHSVRNFWSAKRLASCCKAPEACVCNRRTNRSGTRGQCATRQTSSNAGSYALGVGAALVTSPNSVGNQAKVRESLLHMTTVPGMAPEGLNLLTLAALLKEVSVIKRAQPRIVTRRRLSGPPINTPRRPRSAAAQFRKACVRKHQVVFDIDK